MLARRRSKRRQGRISSVTWTAQEKREETGPPYQAVHFKRGIYLIFLGGGLCFLSKMLGGFSRGYKMLGNLMLSFV